MQACFRVPISDSDREQFAAISGDRNPLHTDAAYARATEFGGPVLHGAFGAGLVSRMAGMHLPGRDCLLHGISLRFVKPIKPPVEVEVTGTVVADNGEIGEVEVQIRDAASGALYTEGGYRFGRHSHRDALGLSTANGPAAEKGAFAGRVAVTGAGGALGKAVCEALGETAIAFTRRQGDGTLHVVDDYESLAADPRLLGISAIVHCAWPAPVEEPLVDLDDLGRQIDFHVAKPLADCVGLAKALKMAGNEGATLVLIGSSLASPGRHGWRTPLYSLSKSMIPTLTRILSVELSATRNKVVGISFDSLDGGMNAGLSPRIRQAMADRTLSGTLPSPREAAEYVRWVLASPGMLTSGSVLNLTGLAVP